MFPTPTSDPLDENVATAPGDLPMPLVIERNRKIRTQFRHDNVIHPLAPRPDQPVLISATAGEGMRISRAAIFYTTDGSLPSEASTRTDMMRGATEWDVLKGYFTYWRGEIPELPSGTVVRYRLAGWLAEGAATSPPDFWAQDGQGFWFHYPPELGLTLFAYRVETEGPKAPAWIEEGVVYHIFVDRFRSSRSDDSMERSGNREVHGGTVEGIRRSLGYLSDLGITTLFLSPMGPADTYHRYDSKDYFGVDPALGTLDDVRNLTAEAHQQGIHFLLDFVPSHLSWKHEKFVEAQQDRNADSYSWFTFYNWPDEYRCFLGMSKALVSINTEDANARKYLIDSARFWIEEMGMDGFRMDHAIGPSMDFWVAFRDAIKGSHPESFTVGEVTDTPDSMIRFRQRLDGNLDFPLARALRSTFGLGQWNLVQFDAFLTDYDRFFANGPHRLSFLDNHDMDRFLFVADQDVERLKMAAIIQFALDATPIVYYGTEIGMTHEHPTSDNSRGGDSQARQDMIWDESKWDTSLRNLYKGLIAARKQYPALRTGTRRSLHVDPEVLVFARQLGNETVIAAVNIGESERTVNVSVDISGTPRCFVTNGEADISAQESTWMVRLGSKTGVLFGA